jgi:hypothetical protein
LIVGIPIVSLRSGSNVKIASFVRLFASRRSQRPG